MTALAVAALFFDFALAFGVSLLFDSFLAGTDGALGEGLGTGKGLGVGLTSSSDNCEMFAIGMANLCVPRSAWWSLYEKWLRIENFG